MSAKYKSPSFLLPNEKNTSLNPSLSTNRASMYSMDFDGTNQTIATSYYWPTGNTAKSISLWFYKDSGSGDATLIGGGQGGSSGKYFGMSSFSYNSRFKIDIYPSIEFSVNSAAFDQWQHIVVTAEPSGSDTILNGYVDGVLDSEFPKTITGGINTGSTAPVTIGENNVLNYNKFPNGKIDEVCIFEKSLSLAEVNSLYNSGSPASSATVLNLGATAYYPLGEQAQNSGYLSASGNEWQFPNGVSQDYVIDFDGSNDCVQINTINLGTTFTASAWINPSGYGGAVLGGNDDNAYVFLIGGSNSVTVKFGGGYNVYTTSTISTGQWYHLAFIRTGTSGELFINGVSQGSSSLSLGSVNFEFQFIGSRSTNTQLFNGKISNVAIWNTDQSANIANIYNNGSPQTTYTVTPQNWWKLNADSVYTPSSPNYTTALDFSSTGFVTATNNVPLTGNSSVSCWFQRRNTVAKEYIWTAGQGGGNSVTGLVGENDAIKSASNLAAFSYSLTGFNAGDWIHSVLTYDGTNTTLFINGTQVATTTSITNNLTASSVINIGNWNRYGNNTVNFAWSSGISNLACFDSALTASQVSTLFNFGTPQSNISFSPLSWYKLDNTTTGLNDLGSGGANASISGTGITQVNTSVAFVPSWKIPTALTIPTINYTSALEFNQPSPNNEYVDIGNITYLNQAGDFSISQWVFSSSNKPYTYNGMSIKLGNGFLYLAHQNGVGLRWEYEFRGGSRQNATTGVAVPEDRWIHIALTVEGTVSKFYQDGYLKHTGTVGTTYSGNPSRIGQEYNSNYAWNGKISNTALFNSALSPSNITTLYNNGQPETTPSFSPLHWWKLDNTSAGLNDVGSAASNNGTLVQTSAPGAEEVATNVYIGSIPVNGVSTTLPSTALQQSDLQFDSPYSNYSLSFDGNSYIDTNFTLPASYTSFSYSFWFKRTTSANPGTEYIISNLVAPGNNNQARGLVRFGGTNLRIQGGDGTSPDYDTGNISATAILDQNWHHISVTFVSGEIKTYFDGSLVNTYTNAAIVTGYAADRTYVIGQNGIGSGYLVNSKLDEFAIFNKKLTEAEILSIYNNGKPNDISSLSPTNWWRLGENAYFVNNNITLPNSVSGAPNGVSSGTATSMISADAPGTYANGIGTNLDIVDRVGDAPLSTANSQSYNMIPDDKVPYVPGYVGNQIANNFSMSFDGINDYITIPNISLSGEFTLIWWMKRTSYANTNNYFFGEDNANNANWVRFNNGDLDIKIGASTGFYYQLGDQGTKPNFTFTNGNWYNVVITRDSNFLIQAYVNGLVDPNYTPLRLPRSTATPVSFAPNTFGRKNTTYLDGIIDEVVIFDKALNAGQVYNDIYQPTATGTNQTADIANNPNLPTPVAWYRMGD